MTEKPTLGQARHQGALAWDPRMSESHEKHTWASSSCPGWPHLTPASHHLSFHLPYPYAAAAAAAESLQSCPTLCDPIDGSPPGSPVPGIPQARTLQWVTISFSNA